MCLDELAPKHPPPKSHTLGFEIFKIFLINGSIFIFLLVGHVMPNQGKVYETVVCLSVTLFAVAVAKNVSK